MMVSKLPDAKTVDINRRSFVKAVGGAAGAVLLSSVAPVPLLAQFGSHSQRDRELVRVPPITDPLINALVLKGVQAARDAGAQYAEVRLSNTLVRNVSVSRVSDSQSVHASVRALVNGYWGFASGPLWIEEAVVTLAQRAVRQAQEGAAVSSARAVDFTELPKIEVRNNEHWQMPVKQDPLSVHPYVMQDFLQGLREQIPDQFGRRAGELVTVQTNATFFVQERAFGSSENSYCTQRLYLTSGTLHVALNARVGNGIDGGSRRIDLLNPAGVGWELFTDQPLCDVAVKNLYDIKADTSLPVKPMHTGKSAVLLDAATVARMLSQTIGATTEIDRALGYEANSTGMSYLNDPAKMLGTFSIGAPMLTVTANRSGPGGAATVKWDDEGVAPQPFTLVNNGVLHDYHLSRESLVWLRHENVTQRDRPYGVVAAVNASQKPQIQTANLEMKPSSTEADRQELMYQVQDGVVIEEADVNIDALKLNGALGGGRAYELKGGKKVARIMNHGVLVYTPEFWKSLYLLGGPRSQVTTGHRSVKGEPVQEAYHSVTTVPAAFRDLTIFDLKTR